MRKIASVAIVGGGSSGWMAAAYLSTVLPGLQVTLVESGTIPVIGVGEATVPLLNNYLARIGCTDPQSWMPSCDATYKTGILFENWYEIGDRYWHPFDYLEYVDTSHHVGHCWFSWRAGGDPAFQDRRSFFEGFFPSTTLNAAELRAPSFREFAFHLDSHRFGEFLRSRSPSVRRVVDDVVDVDILESGEIGSIRTASHGEIAADLYLDCTGFRRRLISRVAPDDETESYSRSLLCDRAVVIRMPYDESDDRERVIRPYVTAAAQAGGWIWSIPLYSKMSSGYVYSSAFLSDDEAEAELRRYWRARDLTGVESLRVRFETGKRRRTWVKNCIAIGLAGGFIEPLESTGLAITQMGIEMAASMLDAHYYDALTIDRYNAHVSKFYADIMHFIVAHYVLTERVDTPFWQAVKHDTLVPDELAARLEVFRRHLPTSGTKGTAEVFMFRDISWFSVLLGMNFEFAPEPVDRSLLTAGRLILERKRAAVSELRAKLPNHYRFLRENIYGPS